MSGARLACIVMSLGNEPGLADAVRSLVTQEPPAEIVVVNSGGGDPAPSLRAAGLDVPVVNHGERLLPGAARNAGIDATRAQYVAFLAGDCVAEPGWVAGRLHRHDAGAEVVASAVVNLYPESAAAAAASLLMHHRRAPTGRPRRQDLYGCSYDRALFDRVGRFRGDLRAAEDTEFNRRLPAEVEIVWAPDVRCAVRYPVGVAAMLRDQWRRGRVMARGRADALRVRRRFVWSIARCATLGRRSPRRSVLSGRGRPAPACRGAAAGSPGGAGASRWRAPAERRRPSGDAVRRTLVGVMDRDGWEGKMTTW